MSEYDGSAFVCPNPDYPTYGHAPDLPLHGEIG